MAESRAPHTLTGIDTTLAMVLSAGIVIVYTVVGGLWAVALTDFIQASILIVGLLLLCFIVLDQAGGWPAVAAQLPSGHLELLPPPGLKSWLWYIQAWIVIGLGGIPAQDIMQRAVSARSENAAVAAGYIAGTMYLVFGMIPVTLGLVAAVTLPGIDNPEFVVPALAMEHLHPVALALVLGAIISGIMSSADSALLAPASVIGENLGRAGGRRLSPRQVLAVSRWSVVLLGLVSLGLALYFQRIYDVMVNSWAILLVALFAPLFAGVYWQRANGTAAVAAILAGLGSWLLLSLLLDEWPADVFAAVVSSVTLVVVAFATGERDAPLPLRTLDGEAIGHDRKFGL